MDLLGHSGHVLDEEFVLRRIARIVVPDALAVGELEGVGASTQVVGQAGEHRIELLAPEQQVGAQPGLALFRQREGAPRDGVQLAVALEQLDRMGELQQGIQCLCLHPELGRQAGGAGWLEQQLVEHAGAGEDIQGIGRVGALDQLIDILVDQFFAHAILVILNTPPASRPATLAIITGASPLLACRKILQ